jgi:hypothetical protein
MKKQFTLLAMLGLTVINLVSAPAMAQTTSEIAKSNCKAASAACQKAVDHCNEKKGNMGQASTTNALKDCIDACKATSQFLERGSRLVPKSAAMTVDACNEAAKICDQFKDDKDMISCANECRKAASNLTKVK